MIENEKAILSACMIDPDAIRVVAPIVDVQDFSGHSNKLLWACCLELYSKKERSTFLAVTNWLERRKKLDEIGVEYLAEVRDYLDSIGVTSTSEAPEWAKEIVDASERRRLIEVTDLIKLSASSEKPLEDVLAEASVKLQGVHRHKDSGFKSLAGIEKELSELADDWFAGRTAGAMSTGFPSLDSVLGGGLRPRMLYVVGARPAMGKCLGRGTPVLMFDGSIRRVEDVQNGDLLMGPDSSPRKVTGVMQGYGDLYKVKQHHGMDYVVNADHILSLKKSREEGRGDRGSVLNIAVTEWLSRPPKFRTNYKGYKASIDWQEKALPVDPYLLGLWLGDGCSLDSNIFAVDEEIIGWLKRHATENGCTSHEVRCRNRISSYRVTSADRRFNQRHSAKVRLARLGVLGKKHIPQIYLVNSRQNRLRLLAGLIDSDGHYMKGQNGPYEITSKSLRLARQIKFLCDSLGYRTSLHKKVARIESTGYECDVYRVRFNGNVDEIPVLLERKRARRWTDRIDWKVTGIAVEPIGQGEYFGFQLDRDGLFLLEDMTVTHNTMLAWSITRNVAENLERSGEDGVVAFVSLEMSKEELAVRAACSFAGIENRDLMAGKVRDPKAKARWLQEIRRLGELPIRVDDSDSLTSAMIRYRVGMEDAITKVQLVVIDFAELVGDSGDGEELRVSAIFRAAKSLAKGLNIPVILLSQLSREVEKLENKLPSLRHLRYGGSAEATSDYVMFCYDPFKYAEMGEKITPAQGTALKEDAWFLLLEKARYGKPGVVTFEFDRPHLVLKDRNIHIGSIAPRGENQGVPVGVADDEDF